MASEPVEPYFTRFLRVLTFCLGVSKIVIFCENGVVKMTVKDAERRKENRGWRKAGRFDKIKGK